MRVCVRCATPRGEGSFHTDGSHPADVCKPCLHRPRRESVISSVKTRRKRHQAAVRNILQQCQSHGESFVYLVSAGRNVKIGFSRDVGKRIQTLETGAAHSVQVLAVVSGGRQLEHELHEKFTHLRTHGEWFRDKKNEILAWFIQRPDSMVFLSGHVQQHAPLVA